MRRAVRSASAPVSSAKDFSDSASDAFGCGDVGVGAVEPRGVRLRFGRAALPSASSRPSAASASAGERALALEVGGELHDPAVEFGDALLGARFFAFERFARDNEPLQRGGGLGFGFAQGGQRGGDLRPAGVDGLRLLAGALGNDADCLVLAALGCRSTSLRRAIQRRWNSSASVRRTCAGDIAIAHRLARLAS